MRWIDLRTGYACNNRCRFCDQGDTRDHVPDAPFATVLDLLRDVRPAAGAVWLAGGEVTLRPDLPAIVRAARELGYQRVGLQTNGRILAAPGAAEALRRAGLTDVAVAVPAATEPIAAWLTGVPGGLRQTLTGARRARAAGLSLRIHTVITRSGQSQLPTLARLAVELGAESHRWILARAQGAATVGVLPRLAAVRAPLAEVVRFEQDARLDVETVGVPLCLLPDRGGVAADRLDLLGPVRVFPPGAAEPVRVHEKPPVCAGCTLAAACPGVDAAYLERWGAEELEPHPAPPLPSARILLPVVAPCAATCPGCGAREAWRAADRAWPTDSTRTLRQRLLRAATLGPELLAFAGASPWSHPALPDLVREAVRLRLPRVEVWGPLFPAADLDPPAMDKLAGLARVVIPHFDPGGVDPAQTARAVARFTAAGIPILQRGLTPPINPFFGVSGPAGIPAGCEPDAA